MTGEAATYKVGLSTYVRVIEFTDSGTPVPIENQFSLCTSCTITYYFSDNYDQTQQPDTLFFKDRRDAEPIQVYFTEKTLGLRKNGTD